MNKYDLEHKLQKGSVLYIDDMPSYKITLAEMADFGFTRAQNIIRILCMDDDKAKEYVSDTVESPTTFLVVVLNIMQEYNLIKSNKTNDDMEDLLCRLIPSFLMLFFKKPVIFDVKYGFVIGQEDEPKCILNDLNYDKFRKILKERNCLINIDSVNDFDNPDNEMARILIEKRKKLNEKLKKAKMAKSDDEDGLTMADLISIFAEAEHIPLQDVYEKYDIYQFNNQFNRLKIMDDFHVNIQALLAGAKSENVKLQHWLSKIKKQDD